MSSAEPAVVPHEPGSQFLDEIREQPEALRRLLEGQAAFAAVAEEMRVRVATTIRMVGHGSSDNAASYGVYAFGLLPGWTALRDSISLTVYYGADLDMSGCTVLALSQSGRTPDVVEYARRARSRGAYVVAVTNDPVSELASASDAVLELRAGAERAVAATKTYSNQVAALGLLAAHAARVRERKRDVSDPQLERPRELGHRRGDGSHVSRSLSAISRAVANSAPRPTTNMRPAYANGRATFPIRSSSDRVSSGIDAATDRTSAANSSPRRAACAARRPSAAT